MRYKLHKAIIYTHDTNIYICSIQNTIYIINEEVIFLDYTLRNTTLCF